MRLPLVALSLLLLFGCASLHSWRKTDGTPAQTAADERDCRKEAETDMGPQPYTSPGSEKFDTPMEMADRSEIRGQFGALVAECMDRKGYSR